MASPIATIRLSNGLDQWLTGRAEAACSNPSPNARTLVELNLWRDAQGLELARTTWTLPEIGAVASVCNGAVVADAFGAPVGMVAGDVIDAINDCPGELGSQWGIDEDALVARLVRLGPVADMALAHAIHQWWATGAENSADGWATVGVIIKILG